ncbi:MAG: ABC transporter permease [Chloroflexota bacterium]|nr:ABC transporter permease [Chloroflexota bacterium]
MDLIVDGLVRAVMLLARGDPELLRVAWLSLQVSGTATLLCLVLGMPLGTVLALTRFPGRGIALALVNAGMGLPPVVVGLMVSIFLWRTGPFGQFRLLYTPTAMVIAQAVIALPIVVGLTVAAIQQLHPKLRLQIRALGASRTQLLWLLLREARLPLLAATMAGFGAVISEVGASIMVGGNIPGQTRVLTTATVLEVSRGEFANAMAFSLVLLALVYGITAALTWLQQRGRPL